jgi:hypothetical protein
VWFYGLGGCGKMVAVSLLPFVVLYSLLGIETTLPLLREASPASARHLETDGCHDPMAILGGFPPKFRFDWAVASIGR